jgi:hypothetical protein
MTELAQLIDCNEIWEVADQLHAFKCQWLIPSVSRILTAVEIILCKNVK